MCNRNSKCCKVLWPWYMNRLRVIVLIPNSANGRLANFVHSGEIWLHISSPRQQLNPHKRCWWDATRIYDLLSAADGRRFSFMRSTDVCHPQRASGGFGKVTRGRS